MMQLTFAHRAASRRNVTALFGKLSVVDRRTRGSKKVVLNSTSPDKATRYHKVRLRRRGNKCSILEQHTACWTDHNYGVQYILSERKGYTFGHNFFNAIPIPDQDTVQQQEANATTSNETPAFSPMPIPVVP